MPGIASAATAVLIGYVAGGTSSIRVGSGGIMLPNHAPIVIAEQFGTLEILYPGRIDLGVGRAPGTDQATARALRRGLNTDVEDFPQQVGELLTLLQPAVPGQSFRAIPGAGTKVPVWLLGSTTYSAQLAAALGLRFAFAGHFAPREMGEALRLYRQLFRPSEWLDRPYAAVGLPIIAAETDTAARHLATSPLLRFLSLIRGETVFIGPPVESMEGRWTPQERTLVESKWGAAVVGGPETVKRGLEAFLKATGADELIITSDIYRHADRLRSYEITSGVMKELIAGTDARVA
jgi:luciferase family oxidoreductase group 1